MPKNNIKLLTKDQLKDFNDKFNIVYDDNDVIVKFYDYARVTRHERGKDFEVNAKHIRKIKFTTQAIEIWIELCKAGKKHTLVDVQNVVNLLIITFQKIDVESVKRALSKPDAKIRKI